uniref:Uncharacterized protein n=1 Tax=Arundo donax TaxID=35708 RepID=A0A0A9HVH6_ARUDO
MTLKNVTRNLWCKDPGAMITRHGSSKCIAAMISKPVVGGRTTARLKEWFMNKIHITSVSASKLLASSKPQNLDITKFDGPLAQFFFLVGRRKLVTRLYCRGAIIVT